MTEDEVFRPRCGDRVKLIGNHPLAGSTGIYTADREFYENGKKYPVVKVEGHPPAVVMDPDNQMRKL